MKQLKRSFLKLLMLFVGLFALSQTAAAWDKVKTSNTYIFDFQKCSYVEDASAVVQISLDNGSSWQDMTRIMAKVYAYKPTSSVDWIKFRRHAPTGDWNEWGYNIPDGQADFTFLEGNSNFNGMNFTGPVRIAGEFVTTNSSWGNYPAAMTWDSSKNAFKYTASKGGACMVSTNNNFWDGRVKMNNGTNIASSQPSSSNISLSTSGDLNLPDAGTIYFRPFDMKLWYEATSTPTPTTYSYVVRFWGGSLSGDTNIAITPGTAKTFSTATYKGCEFGIERQGSDGSKTWYASNSSSNKDVLTNTTGNRTTTFTLTSSGSTNMVLPSTVDDGNFTYTLTVSNDVPTSLTVVSPPASPAGVYYFVNDMTTGNDAYTKTGRISVGDTFEIDAMNGTGYFIFCNGSNLDWDNSYASKGDYNVSDVTSTIEAKYRPNNSDYTQTFNTVNGKYIITITDISVNNVVKFTVAKKALDDPSKAGHVYLLAKQLNGNKETPEWRMEKTGTNTYTLKNFAMRSKSAANIQEGDNVTVKDNGDVTVVWYDASGKRNSKNFGNEVYSHLWDLNELQPGWAYTAEFKLNGESSTLTMNQLNNPNSTSTWTSDVLPYIGLLGKNFKQATKYDTQNSGTGMGDTSKGWQEAYVQYDETGHVLRDENGKAYYNTYWPPRNNILMQADLNDGKPVNVSTRNTTFKLDKDNGALTGAQWKALLTDATYEGLKLDASQKYYRYTINNMWMLGTYKIWTGWASNTASWGAYWNSHLFWGPNVKDGDKWADQTTTSGVTYDALANKDTKDFNIDGKSYFTSMELFIPVTATSATALPTNMDFSKSKLYLTESIASIDAMAKEIGSGTTKEDHVGYAPQLDKWLNGFKTIKSYTITRYAYDPNAEEGNYEPCNKEGETDIDPADAVVKTASVNYTEPSDFNNAFTKSSTIPGYVDDGKYAPGLYIYSLEIEFAKEDGTTKSITVWSPYVEIIDNDYTVKVETAQLIKLPTADDLNSEEVPEADRNIVFEGFTHATYNTANNPLLVNIVNGEVTDVERASNVDGFTTAKYIKIKEKYGKWTNDAIIRTAEPASFLNQAKTKTISTFNVTRKLKTADDNTATLVKDLKTNAEKIGSYYYLLDQTNGTNLNKVTYTVSFAGTGTSYANSTINTGNKTDNVDYTPTFMQPRFDVAKSRLYFDDDTSTDTYTASHGDLKYIDPEDNEDNNSNQQKGVTTYRHELRADVVLKMPNIATPELRKAVVDNLKMTFTKDNASYVAYGDGTVKTDTYGLSYRYQNPTDWVEKNGEIWNKGVSQTWGINTASYNGVTGVVPTLTTDLPSSVKLETKPQFSAPAIHKETAVEYYFTGNVDKEKSQRIMDVYIRKLDISSSNNTDYFVAANDVNSAFMQEDDVTFIFNVTADKTKVTKAWADKDKVTIEPINKIVSYQNLINTHVTNPDNDWEQVEADEWVARITMPYYENNSEVNINKNFENLNNALEALNIRISYAYFFSAGFGGDNNGDNFGGVSTSHSQSGYMGFHNDATGSYADSTFPTIRFDHGETDFGNSHDDAIDSNPANVAMRRANGTNDNDLKLTNGDSAFLLVPYYTDVKAYGETVIDGQLTGVGQVELPVANVLVGRGFIDLNGNEGMIYSTDGRALYQGNGRKNLESGVYVVTFAGRSLKVLVK